MVACRALCFADYRRYAHTQKVAVDLTEANCLTKVKQWPLTILLRSDDSIAS